MSEKFTPNFETAKSAAESLVKLFADPQPGLSTWHSFVGAALSALDLSLFPVEELKAETAAPELLAACKEFVRKCECGEARSRHSYAQMKAAIEKAEVKDVR